MPSATTSRPRSRGRRFQIGVSSPVINIDSNDVWVPYLKERRDILRASRVGNPRAQQNLLRKINTKEQQIINLMKKIVEKGREPLYPYSYKFHMMFKPKYNNPYEFKGVLSVSPEDPSFEIYPYAKYVIELSPEITKKILEKYKASDSSFEYKLIKATNLLKSNKGKSRQKLKAEGQYSAVVQVERNQDLEVHKNIHKRNFKGTNFYGILNAEIQAIKERVKQNREEERKNLANQHNKLKKELMNLKSKLQQRQQYNGKLGEYEKQFASNIEKVFLTPVGGLPEHLQMMY